MRIPLFGILFLLLPILEIATIIMVGNAIGLWATLGLLLGTSFLGILILRWNAVSIAKKLQRGPAMHEQGQSEQLGTDFVATSMRSMGAILMILPGFICKTIGFLFLLPPLQTLLWASLGSKMRVYRTGASAGFRYNGQSQNSSQPPRRSGPTVVDLDEDDFERHPNQSSPWYDNKNDGDQKRID